MDVEGDAEPLLSLPVATVFFVTEGLPPILGEDAVFPDICSNIRRLSLTFGESLTPPSTLLLPPVGLVTLVLVPLERSAAAGLSFLSVLSLGEVLDAEDDDLDFLKPPRLPRRLVAGEDISVTNNVSANKTIHTDSVRGGVCVCANCRRLHKEFPTQTKKRAKLLHLHRNCCRKIKQTAETDKA